MSDTDKLVLDIESKKNLDDIMKKLFKSSTVGNMNAVLNGLSVIKSLGYKIIIKKN